MSDEIKTCEECGLPKAQVGVLHDPAECVCDGIQGETVAQAKARLLCQRCGLPKPAGAGRYQGECMCDMCDGELVRVGERPDDDCFRYGEQPPQSISPLVRDWMIAMDDAHVVIRQKHEALNDLLALVHRDLDRVTLEHYYRALAAGPELPITMAFSDEVQRIRRHNGHPESDTPPVGSASEDAEKGAETVITFPDISLVQKGVDVGLQGGQAHLLNVCECETCGRLMASPGHGEICEEPAAGKEPQVETEFWREKDGSSERSSTMSEEAMMDDKPTSVATLQAMGSQADRVAARAENVLTRVLEMVTETLGERPPAPATADDLPEEMRPGGIIGGTQSNLASISRCLDRIDEELNRFGG